MRNDRHSAGSQYDLFICYIEQDWEFVEALESALKKHKPAKGLNLPHKHLTIFKDAPELGSTEYEGLIENQLQQSRKLVVICSDSAQRDPLVNHKIRAFAATHGRENIIPVIVDNRRRASSPTATLPEALRGFINPEDIPRYQEFSGHREKVENGAYQVAWHTLLAQIYDRPRSEIAREEKKRRLFARRRRQIELILGVGLLVAVVGGLLWRQHVQSARLQRTQQAGEYWQRSQLLARDGRSLAALHLLVQALALRPEAALYQQLLDEARNSWPAARLVAVLPDAGIFMGARFDRRETRLLTWSDAGTARLWTLPEGKSLDFVARHDGQVYGAQWSADERRILTWSADQTARWWDSQTGAPLGEPLRQDAGIVGARLSRDENRLLTWSEDFTVRLWQVDSGTPLGNPGHHDGWVNGTLFNRAETRFLTWSDDSTARLWDATTGRPLSASLRHDAEVNGACFTPDESGILTWDNTGTIQRWSIATGRPSGVPLKHRRPVLGARFNRRGDRILSWGKDNTARLWQARNGRSLIPPLQHRGWVFGASLDSTEQRILTWSFDNTARLWDARSGEPLTPPLQHSTGPRGSDAGVFGARLSREGGYIVTWGDDNTARLWDARSGEPLGVPLQHDNGGMQNREVRGALLNAASTLLFTWSSDSTGRLWQIALPDDPSPAGIGDRGDRDFPSEHLQLQVLALTGTYLDSLTQTVHCLPVDRWRKLQQRYREVARRHSQECRYAESNLWRRFFPEAAAAIRSQP